MPQVRVEKKSKYTQIDNNLIRNRNLSLKAKGLLIYMLSLPDDWDYTISGLSAECKEGKSSIRSAIDELMKHRYITRSLVRGAGGLLDGYEYVVYEEQQPLCENRMTDNRTSENHTQQIKDLTNKEETNSPYSPPAGDAPPPDPVPEDKPAPKPRREKSMPTHDPDAFEVFWAAYPRKDDRRKAIRAWDKLKPDKPLCRVMYTALLRQKASDQWARDGGQYIPMFPTWINGRRWEDQGVDPSLLLRPRDTGSTGGSWKLDPGMAPGEEANRDGGSL